MINVSVITPVYNGADHLAETIQSVLDQTYRYFEFVLVNDGSSDQSSEVIHQFSDPRIIYIKFERNRGVDLARNTGIRASKGDIIAFLDQDDIFHPDKLQVHVDYLEKNPEIGFTYNSRFELNHSASTIRGIWQPPIALTLSAIVLEHQLSPSDMVVRREWAQDGDLWDESYPLHGGGNQPIRLFVNGWL